LDQDGYVDRLEAESGLIRLRGVPQEFRREMGHQIRGVADAFEPQANLAVGMVREAAEQQVRGPAPDGQVVPQRVRSKGGGWRVDLRQVVEVGQRLFQVGARADDAGGDSLLRLCHGHEQSRSRTAPGSAIGPWSYGRAASSVAAALPTRFGYHDHRDEAPC